MKKTTTMKNILNDEAQNYNLTNIEVSKRTDTNLVTAEADGTRIEIEFDEDFRAYFLTVNEEVYKCNTVKNCLEQLKKVLIK